MYTCVILIPLNIIQSYLPCFSCLALVSNTPLCISDVPTTWIIPIMEQQSPLTFKEWFSLAFVPLLERSAFPSWGGLETSFNIPRVFPFQSGSQNDLCDTWTPEEEDRSNSRLSRLSGVATNNNPVGSSAGIPGARRANGTSAEYPFHMNLCMPKQGINFDLTHKRGKTTRIRSKARKFRAFMEIGSDFYWIGFLVTPTETARFILVHNTRV